jgi:hypothetical protein
MTSNVAQVLSVCAKVLNGVTAGYRWACQMYPLMDNCLFVCSLFALDKAMLRIYTKNFL